MNAHWDLEEALGFWLHLAQNRVRAEAEKMMAPFGVVPEQWAILCKLWVRDDVQPSELAAAIFRDKAMVTRLLRGLDEKGYIRRGRDPEDARAQRIVLTQNGRALEQQLLPRVQRFVERWTRNISARDLEITKRTLRTLYSNLQSRRP